MNNQKIAKPSFRISLDDISQEPKGFRIERALRYAKGIIIVEFSLEASDGKDLIIYQVELTQKNSFSLQTMVKDPVSDWLNQWQIFATGKHNNHVVVSYKIDADLAEHSIYCILPDNLIRAICSAIRYALSGQRNHHYSIKNIKS